MTAIKIGSPMALFSRRALLAAGAGSTVFTALAGCRRMPSLGAPHSTVRPNFLFISVDDMNDWTGFLGGHPQARTPHLDALAARSTIFDKAYCSAPGCNQSRASVMTGRAPHTSGVYTNRQPFRLADSVKNCETIPQRLRREGYRTLGAGKIYHNKFPDPASWDVFYPELDRQAPDPVDAPAVISGVPDGDRGELIKMMSWGSYENGEPTLDEAAVEWGIEQLRQSWHQPTFLAVGLNLPHSPWYVPQKFTDLFQAKNVFVPPSPSDDIDDLPSLGRAIFRQNEAQHRAVSNADMEPEVVAAYLAAIAYVDDAVGRIIHAFEKGPNADNTIVVLWSDHGYHLGEKSNWSKFTLWEEATRVPLLISMPGAKAGRCYEPVSLVDLYPTLLDLAGVEVDPALDGASLAPQLRNPAEARTAPALTTHLRGNHALRSRDFRYIRYSDGSEELYDHRSDPYEWANLSQNPAFSNEMVNFRRFLPETDAPDGPAIVWPEDKNLVAEAIWQNID